MKTQPLDQFKELIAQAKANYPTAHVDEYPSEYHYEARFTHKIYTHKHLSIAWRECGITINVGRQTLQPQLRKTLIAVNLPSITYTYLQSTLIKHLYDQN
jgi:hypothetical protein